NLTLIEQTEYIMDAWIKSVSAKPNALILTDERHPRGISRRKADELSAQIFDRYARKEICRRASEF
ncbi:MAG: hypothetical protein K6E53_00475, partial [Lachnospiraceae bacterium]|nr:hypothetical protein [Lachnospiraceae bacterium]